MRCARPVLPLACLAAVLLGGAGPHAQERFGGRLSRMPVDLITTHTVSGSGEVSATLAGGELTVVATFEGLGSAATAAHLHRAPRGRRGPVAFEVAVPDAAAGRIEARLRLAGPQLADLRTGRYYLQIHTAGNPDGELRGWLLPRPEPGTGEER